MFDNLCYLLKKNKNILIFNFQIVLYYTENKLFMNNLLKYDLLLVSVLQTFCQKFDLKLIKVYWQWIFDTYLNLLLQLLK